METDLYVALQGKNSDQKFNFNLNSLIRASAGIQANIKEDRDRTSKLQLPTDMKPL